MSTRAVTPLRFVRHVVLWFVALLVIPPVIVVLIGPALVNLMR